MWLLCLAASMGGFVVGVAWSDLRNELIKMKRRSDVSPTR